jgi:hypothetical protein
MSLWKKVKSLFTGETLEEKFEKILIEEDTAPPTETVVKTKNNTRKRHTKNNK